MAPWRATSAPTLRRHHPIGEDRRGVKIGQGQRRSRKPGGVRHQRFQRAEAGLGPGERGGDPGFIAHAAVLGRPHALDIDVPDEGTIGVAVEDAQDLIDPRPFPGILRLQRRSGKGLVHIARDRAALIEAEPVMLEGGDAPEGLTRRIFRRRPALGEDVDLHQPIGHALFRQRQPRDTDIDAIGSAEEDGVGQGRFLLSGKSYQVHPHLWNRMREPVNLVLGAGRGSGRLRQA